MLLLLAAVSCLEADTATAGIDREVVVAGADLVVLAAPPPAGWGRVDLPGLDLALPVEAREPPEPQPAVPPAAPAAPQVLALMEVPDA